MIGSYTNRVKEIIANHKLDWVFSHVDFDELDNVAIVKKVLSRMLVSGEIKRIRRGMYYIPENSRWGEVPPLQSNIIKALSRSMNTDFIPDGANALYQLGLTQQVPMKQVYLTDKQISTISIGKTKIEFKKVSPKKLSGAANGVSVYLSALEYLGKEEVLEESVKSRIANTIDKSMVAKLEEASESRAVWVREIVKEITKRVM